MADPTPEFWQQRFATNNTPWDRGAASPQLAAWLAAGTLAPCRILVPGCGAGYEVAALARAGFDVTAIDFAPAAVSLTRECLVQARLSAVVEQADVCDWQPTLSFDAIYEQTCLCALHPDQWRGYADRLDAWLTPGGKLCALFMQVARAGAAEGRVEGPPYHCDINAMRALLPASRWQWPAPPYARVPHPRGWGELAVVLTHRRTV
jgi:SAM-dependent methyltransferase